MADSFEKILNDIEGIRTETRKERNTQFRVGGVMRRIFEFLFSLFREKTTVYYSKSDPRTTNVIITGDKWITPNLIGYTDIDGVWINLSGTVYENGATIFNADVIRCNGSRKLIINANGNRNYLIKNK